MVCEMSSTNTRTAVKSTDLPYPGRRQGKVRDVYPIPAGDGEARRLLIVASDRVSAFDVVLPDPMPGKGVLLTKISTGFFDFVRELNLIPDHLLSTDPGDLPGLSDAERSSLEGRIMIGRAAKVVPIECVVRGHIAGSGWKEYRKSGTVCGIPLPEGLKLSDRLPEPLFTPSTKADEGHDENISFETACELVGTELMTKLRDLSLEIYTKAAAYAAERGIILADTKFEFGHALDLEGNPTDELIIIDEVLTPDSSRFWPANDFEPGREQASFDKQIVRNWLQAEVDAGRWDKTAPGPILPNEVVQKTLARYQEAAGLLF
jgi:phosphoribosylaminoimidazole-succinocarboxamide synthase